jgi:hypothetical protein
VDRKLRANAALIKGRVVKEVSYNPLKSLRNKAMIVPVVLGAGEREWRLKKSRGLHAELLLTD